MTVTACAIYLGRTEKAVYRLVERGQIPFIRTGRRLSFDRDKVDGWLARHASRGQMV